MSLVPRVIQVVPRIAAISSGPSLSVPSLSAALASAGCAVQLMALEPAPAELVFGHSTFFPCNRLPLAGRLGASTQLLGALIQAAKTSDIMHTNSLWMMPNIYPERAIKGTNCKLVVSPRGTLSAWALQRSRVRKWLVTLLGQRRCLNAAHCIHATSMDELSQIRRAGYGNPVAVIPNGIECDRAQSMDVSQPRAIKTLLFLARIHPKKGVDILLEAWKALESRFPDWRLKIAGPIDHSYARQMISKSKATRRVEFCGELTGDVKNQCFRDADLYVLPTHSENFGISVAEALAHGLPAIVFSGAPWQGLNEKNAGWWIEPGVASLVDTLHSAMTLSEHQRFQMGQNGQQWMREEFDWKAIGQRMSAVYRWLIDGGDAPPDVHLS